MDNQNSRIFIPLAIKGEIVLSDVKHFIKRAEEEKQTNEQWFLDFEDKLNKLSIKDHDRNKHIED